MHELTEKEFQNLEKHFLLIYDEYADSIYRHCFFRLKQNHEKALDVTQRAFEKTWKALLEKPDIKNIKAYVYTTATHLIIDDSRKKKEDSLEVLTENGLTVSDNTHNKIISNSEYQLLYKKLLLLSQEDQNLIIMRYINGFKPKEIADILNLSQNVISVRINRAKKKLKDVFKKNK